MIEDDIDEEFLRNQILSILYQFKQQGVDEIRSADLMSILGFEEDEIPPEEYDVWISLPEAAQDEAELALAKLTKNIH